MTVDCRLPKNAQKEITYQNNSNYVNITLEAPNMDALVLSLSSLGESLIIDSCASLNVTRDAS